MHAAGTSNRITYSSDDRLAEAPLRENRVLVDVELDSFQEAVDGLEQVVAEAT